jgi:hypothetical protein
MIKHKDITMIVTSRLPRSVEIVILKYFLVKVLNKFN